MISTFNQTLLVINKIIIYVKIFTQNFCSEGYEIIINESLAPFVHNYPGGCIVIQDNSPTLSAINSREAIIRNNIRVLKLPPYSPDINVIELMWHDLKFFLRKKQCHTIAELNYRIQQFFQYKLTIAKCRSYIDRILDVLNIIIERKGDWSDC